MAEYGIKVSIPGFDVGTASGSQLSLYTGNNMFKIFSAASTTLPAGAAGTIPHNLGYVPNYFVLGEDTPGSGGYQYYNGNQAFNLLPRADGTNLIIQAVLTPSGTYHLYYYIFVDPM